ncbi:MAG: fimbria/pilus outer membrane usher protein [Terracidiphilus sp.]
MLTTVSAVASATEEASDPAKEKTHSSSNDVAEFLEVIVNGRSTGKIGEFTLRNGLLYAKPQELNDLGFRVPSNHRLAFGGLISLSDLPGFVWTYDVRNQQLRVTALDSVLIPTTLTPNEGEAPWSRRQIESGNGLTLNYDMVGTFAGGQNGGSGSFDLRSFAPWGIVSSDWLTYTGAASSIPGTNRGVRLDSAYTLADVNSLRRYSVGDFTNSSLSWARPVHMEGAQIRSDFSMRPDLVTFPLPTLAGSAAVPSTVDVLVNGNLVASNQVDPGPFEIPQLPVISGAGTITMTMTNAQGQQVSVTQPFYGGSTLLAPGLQTYSGQAGLVRRNWGTVSDDYGQLAGSALYRRGLTKNFTIEASSEGTPGAYLAGAGGAATIGTIGLFNFDFAGSGGSGSLGELLSLGAQHIGTKFSLGGSAIFANRNYRDMASINGSGILRKQITAFTGLFLRHFGSAGVAYAGVDEDASPNLDPTFGSPAEHSHVVTANYSVQIHRISFFATEFRSLDQAGVGGFQAGFTIPLGRRTSISGSGSSDGSGQLQIQQTPVRIGDWGYEAYVAGGNTNHEFGQVQYKSPVGLFFAGVDHQDGLTTTRFESQGAISLADRALFPSNTIFDSFAVVDTSPLEHVRVYQDNRDVGTTDKTGRLLVPDMRSFDVNHIGIEPTDVPADATLNIDKQVVRPQDRSGVVVRFPIHFSHGALLRLVDQSNTPIAVGSTVTLRATGVKVSVGYDGEAFVEDLSSHNELIVDRVDGRTCVTDFDYKPIPGDIPTIGPLRCQERQP